ncbi:hypothetical protein Dimus_010352 [Dionaea muscipula]
MKLSISNLNPDAQSYVPLAKREVNNENHDYKNILKSVGSNVYGTQKLPAAADWKLKGQEIDVLHGFPSQNPQGIDESRFMDKQFEMDLAYLRMMFPGVSDQSLIDVYDANRRDLEPTIDLLVNLESYIDDSINNLPEALDMGDIPQHTSSGECSMEG